MRCHPLNTRIQCAVREATSSCLTIHTLTPNKRKPTQPTYFQLRYDKSSGKFETHEFPMTRLINRCNLLSFRVYQRAKRSISVICWQLKYISKSFEHKLKSKYCANYVLPTPNHLYATLKYKSNIIPNIGTHITHTPWQHLSTFLLLFFLTNSSTNTINLCAFVCIFPTFNNIIGKREKKLRWNGREREGSNKNAIRNCLITKNSGSFVLYGCRRQKVQRIIRLIATRDDVDTSAFCRI